MFNDRLRGTITQVGGILKDAILVNLGDGHTPQELTNNTVLGQPEQVEDSISIKVITSGETAHAYEYGSGIHATKGAASTYPIEPKKSDALYIDINDWPKYKAPDGRATPKVIKLLHVDHPGVAPKHYTEEAIASTQDVIFSVIGDAAFRLISDVLDEAITNR